MSAPSPSTQAAKAKAASPPPGADTNACFFGGSSAQKAGIAQVSEPTGRREMSLDSHVFAGKSRLTSCSNMGQNSSGALCMNVQPAWAAITAENYDSKIISNCGR